MDKCEGCTFGRRRLDGPEIWTACRIDAKDSCQLASDDCIIINAMILGEFDCNHCEHLDPEPDPDSGFNWCKEMEEYEELDWFCPHWRRGSKHEESYVRIQELPNEEAGYEERNGDN